MCFDGFWLIGTAKYIGRFDSFDAFLVFVS